MSAGWSHSYTWSEDYGDILRRQRAGRQRGHFDGDNSTRQLDGDTTSYHVRGVQAQGKTRDTAAFDITREMSTKDAHAEGVDSVDRHYECTIHLALPSAQCAQHLRDVISVDREISNKVVKTISVVDSDEDVKGEEPSEGRVLRIHFEATDAKMLRVSVSTTYDMINVALKCFAEFG